MEWIFIYGPPGSGKSTLGKALAEKLNKPYLDLDTFIENRSGQTIPEIFSSQGESSFRSLESDALRAALGDTPGVMALGGGALLDERNRFLVEAAGQVICLYAPFELLLRRTESQAGQRPLLDGELRQRLSDLMAQRKEHYASFPLRLDTGEGVFDDLLWKVQVTLGAFRVSGMGTGYDIRIIPGSLDHLGSALRLRSLKGPVVLVSDENVAPLYAQRVMASLQKADYRVSLFHLPAGEEHKTVSMVERIWNEMLVAGLERGSTLIALGGGVIGDLAGFAAATFMRGLPWVAVPTSLLAMVDASLGGKTGADLPQGKNLVGAFHPPSLVMTDPEVLLTLPEVELVNGMAEVIKHGIMADPALFDLCSLGMESLSGQWTTLVRHAVAVKAAVIQEDPYEKGRRASLNLGHTLGHAIELASDFTIRHGEAVAIGMVFAARISQQMGIASSGLSERIVQILERWDLPVEIPDGLDRRRILDGIKRDKKRAGGVARFVLPVRVGEVKWGIPVEDMDSLLY